MQRARKTRTIRTVMVIAAGTAALVACAVGAFGLPGRGDDGPPQKDMAMDGAARSEVLDSLISTLDHHYVYQDKAATIGKDLRARLAHGDFDSITSADKFAKALTDALQSLTNDRHLEVRYLEAPIPVPTAGIDDDPAEAAAFLAERKRLNFGFAGVRRLSCNIGYLDLREFGRPDQVAGRIEATMTLLADTRALIIDLRKMHGGDPESVMLMASYLFDQPTHLNDIYWREDNRTEKRWTQAEVPGRKYGQTRPVSLLTSESTFSAGEDFAYALKYSGRATLVGETTGGGAHPGNRRRLSEHFMMNVPTGRAINPVTHTDWEGVGVKPDVAVAAKNALDIAQIGLLKQRLATETNPDEQGHIKECISQLD